MKDKKTFCIGYWALNGSAKHDLAHYDRYLPETLQMLSGRNVIFFYGDPHILRIVEKYSALYKIDLLAKKILLEDLPARLSASRILLRTEEYGESYSEAHPKITKEKALEHYFRDYLKSGRDTYLDMLSIWLSKVLLLGEISKENCFKSTNFAWVDASISRFNSTRDFYDISKLADRPGRISFYRGKLLKYGNKLTLNASYLSGGRKSWLDLQALYADRLVELEDEVYPNDEETILHSCYQDKPSLFWVINPRRHPIISKGMQIFRLGAYW